MHAFCFGLGRRYAPPHEERPSLKRHLGFKGNFFKTRNIHETVGGQPRNVHTLFPWRSPRFHEILKLTLPGLEAV